MESGPQGRGRLTRSAEFDAVYRRGRSAASRHLVAYAFPSEQDETRLGIAVSRKVGGAVVRNQMRRLGLLRVSLTLEERIRIADARGIDRRCLP